MFFVEVADEEAVYVREDHLGYPVEGAGSECPACLSSALLCDCCSLFYLQQYAGPGRGRYYVRIVSCLTHRVEEILYEIIYIRDPSGAKPGELGDKTPARQGGRHLGYPVKQRVTCRCCSCLTINES